jgi:hypothetical protein
MCNRDFFYLQPVAQQKIDLESTCFLTEFDG